MTLREQLTEARPPTMMDALLLLADAIELRLYDLEHAAEEGSPFDQPLDWGRTDSPDPEPSSDGNAGSTPAASTIDDEIARTEAALAETTDGQDAEALSAKLRVLRDQAGLKVYDQAGSKMGDDSTPEGRRAKDNQERIAGAPTQAIAIPGGGTVELPVVSEERQAARIKWAKEHKLHTFIPPLTEAEAAVNYAKGGPMWLYLGNRTAVMQMPMAWRQELVAEVHEDSPLDARKMGRDVLKFQEGVDRDYQSAVIDQIRASR